MVNKTIFAGFGGQGIMSMGLNLAHSAMLDGKNVTYMPSYGAEVRGGTANCTVAVSDEEIASPVASSPQFVVAMNEPSMVRFQNQIQSGGLFFINSSLFEPAITRGDIDIVEVSASGMAEDLGNPRTANMIMLAAFVKKSNLVSLKSLIKGMEDTLKKKKKLIPINRKAIKAGYELF